MMIQVKPNFQVRGSRFPPAGRCVGCETGLSSGPFDSGRGMRTVAVGCVYVQVEYVATVATP